MEPIHPLSRSGWVVYACLASWAAYYLLIPYIFAHMPLAGLCFAALLGPYIGIWAIYLMHECWHRYFTRIDNRQMFVVLCCMLFTQPGAYGIGHRSHHRMVNTYQDLEIYPAGRIDGRLRRAVYYIASFMFGSLLLVFFGLGQAGSDDSAEARFDRWMPLAWLVVWGGMAMLSHLITGASWRVVSTAYASSIWATSLLHRHNEMLEHGAVIGDGSLEFRASLTRNLIPHGWLEKLFLLLVHHDCRAHTLHHTQPSTNWRINPIGTGSEPLPENAIQITLGQYLRIVGKLMLGIEPDIAFERAFTGGQSC